MLFAVKSMGEDSALWFRCDRLSLINTVSGSQNPASMPMMFAGAKVVGDLCRWKFFVVRCLSLVEGVFSFNVRSTKETAFRLPFSGDAIVLQLNVAGLVNNVPETVSWVCSMMEVVVFTEDMLILRCHPKQGGCILSICDYYVITEDQFPSVPICFAAVSTKMNNLLVPVTNSLYEKVFINKCLAIIRMIS